MLTRFSGVAGRRILINAISGLKLVAGNVILAGEIADRVELLAFKPGIRLIEQDGVDNDIYLLLTGQLHIEVNGRRVATRFTGDHVGEMAAIEPTQRRSATVIAANDVVVGKMQETDFAELGLRYPELYRCIARELSRRISQRNQWVTEQHLKTRVFLICSAEAIPVGRLVQNAFAHDLFTTTLWTNGVFRVTHYTLESLEQVIDQSDFAVAIAHGDDVTTSRGKDWPTPRDNVIFELGLFMGRLGRQRAILMEPREDRVRLPSDLAGVSTIPYRYEIGGDAATLIAPACNVLREHIMRLGPNN